MDLQDKIEVTIGITIVQGSSNMKILDLHKRKFD